MKPNEKRFYTFSSLQLYAIEALGQGAHGFLIHPRTARSLVSHKLIEPNGPMAYRLTERGTKLFNALEVPVEAK
jgi:hypothetical protein